LRDLTLKDFESSFDLKQYQEYMLQKSVDEFLNGTIAKELHPVTSKIVEYVHLPDIGSHLVTPRIGYTHHGIYVGNKEVIQYSGFSGESFNSDDIVPIDTTKRSPVEKVHLKDFTQGKDYSIEDHPHATYSADEIVKRAHQRLNESEYNLVFNNCEHFANWCIYGIKESNQVNNAVRVAGHAAKPIRIVADAQQAVRSLKNYISGDISGEKLLQDIGHISTTSATSFYYGVAGQTFIPIPLVGFAIGSTVGYIIGNLLYSSGLFSLTGDAAIVKQAKKRRAKIEKISSVMLPIMQENRKRLEQYISKYMSERKEIFEQAFLEVDRGFKENNSELIASSLSKINNQYSKELTHKSMGDFKDWLNN
jgi:hypothetical protein